MIISSINDKLREEIYWFTEVEANEYFNILEPEDYDIYLKILVLDALKILEIKSRKSSLMLNETKLLHSELKRNSIEDIIVLLKNNYNYFCNVFEQARQFYLLPIINRCYITEELSNYNFDKKLMELSTLHVMDLVVYQIQNDLDSINHYYRDYKDAVGVDYIKRFYPMALELLKNLKKENIEEFNKSYLEIIKSFYMTYKYIDTISNVKFEGKSISNLLEIEELEIAKEEIFNDVKKFSEVISYYFIYNNNEIVDKEEVQVFCKKYLRNDMKKKLGIND